jgi:glyceraldehyde 3-phosphate dehydrogenase
MPRDLGLWIAAPEEVNRVFTEEPEGERHRGVVGVTIDPIVSSDIIKDPRASVLDLAMTQVVDRDLIKVMSWYDNEWGYSNQLVREAVRVASAVDRPSIGTAKQGTNVNGGEAT